MSWMNLIKKPIFWYTLLISLLAVFIFDSWDHFLHKHILVEYTANQIIYKGSGWHIFSELWPLWLIPSAFFSALTLLCYQLLTKNKCSKTHKTDQTFTIKNEEIFTVSSLTEKLTIKSLQKELAETREKLANAIKIAETNINKKLALEQKLQPPHNESP